MTRFEPFDGEYEIDKSILSEEVAPFLQKSIRLWLNTLFANHSILRKNANGMIVLDGKSFLFPLQETFRKEYPDEPAYFVNLMFSNTKLFRNMLSYILQNHADINEARELEEMLMRSSSAYAVEFIKGEELRGLKRADGSPLFKTVGCKLVYRVPPIVKVQAEEAFSSEALLAEAWEAYYGMQPDDEKVVTRATDALAGSLRDKYFPDEKRPVFGTLLQKIKQDPTAYPLPGSSIYEQQKFAETMDQFSKIRGNHQKGTGRKPTHEEAGFVLHFSIMLYQVLRGVK